MLRVWQNNMTCEEVWCIVDSVGDDDIEINRNIKCLHINNNDGCDDVWDHQKCELWLQIHTQSSNVDDDSEGLPPHSYHEKYHHDEVGWG